LQEIREEQKAAKFIVDWEKKKIDRPLALKKELMRKLTNPDNDEEVRGGGGG
jgi:hypothetical protein